LGNEQIIFIGCINLAKDGKYLAKQSNALSMTQRVTNEEFDGKIALH